MNVNEFMTDQLYCYVTSNCCMKKKMYSRIKCNQVLQKVWIFSVINVSKKKTIWKQKDKTKTLIQLLLLLLLLWHSGLWAQVSVFIP